MPTRYFALIALSLALTACYNKQPEKTSASPAQSSAPSQANQNTRPNPMTVEMPKDRYGVAYSAEYLAELVLMNVFDTIPTQNEMQQKPARLAWAYLYHQRNANEIVRDWGKNFPIRPQQIYPNQNYDVFVNLAILHHQHHPKYAQLRDKALADNTFVASPPPSGFYSIGEEQTNFAEKQFRQAIKQKIQEIDHNQFLTPPKDNFTQKQRAARLAYAVLQSSKQLEEAHIGQGWQDAQHMAINLLLRQADAALFKQLFADSPNLSGKIYALTGLYYADRASYEPLKQQLDKNSVIQFYSNDTGFGISVAEAITQIENGTAAWY